MGCRSRGRVCAIGQRDATSTPDKQPVFNHDETLRIALASDPWHQTPMDPDTDFMTRGERQRPGIGGPCRNCARWRRIALGAALVAGLLWAIDTVVMSLWPAQ